MFTLPRLNLFILIVCSLLAIRVDAQLPETNPEANAANHWIFGNEISLEFAGDTVVESNNQRFYYLEGPASYYYEQDSILINCVRASSYTGIAIGDSIQHRYLDFEGTQANIILRHPEDTSIFLFTSIRTGFTNYFTFNVRDQVLSFHRIVANGGEKQQATKHQNGRDLWYVNHANEGDSIYFFLLKKSGLLECPVKCYTGLSYNSGPLGFSSQGQMKISITGDILAEVVSSNPFGYGIYSFENDYPQLDSIYIFNKGFPPPYTKRWPYGLEISPSSEIIYLVTGRSDESVSGADPVILYQLELNKLVSDTMGSTWNVLDSLWDIDNGALQLGPDGRIYHSIPGKKYLGVINNPDSSGTACNYQRQGLILKKGGISTYGLPTFNQSYFYTPAIDFKYKENCFSNTYQFEGLDTFGANQHSWRIENVNSGTISIQNQKNIEFQFEANGLENRYKVTYIANNGIKSDSVSETITIRPKLVHDFLGRDSFYCQGDKSFAMNLNTPPDLHCIHWNGEEPYKNIWGDTVIGYENFYGHVHENQSLRVDTAGTYTCRITNKTFCQAWDTITIEEKPVPDQPSILRSGQSINSTLAAAQYHWYRNGKLVSITTDDEITPDTNGYYQVQLESEFGCLSTVSDSFLVDFASVQDPERIQLAIYPNPSNGVVNISIGPVENYEIKVYDAQGKLVLQRANVAQFELSEAGNYVVEVHTEKGVRTKSILIQ